MSISSNRPVSKFLSVKLNKPTSGKATVKFLRTYVDTHGKPE